LTSGMMTLAWAEPASDDPNPPATVEPTEAANGGGANACINCMKREPLSQRSDANTQQLVDSVTGKEKPKAKIGGTEGAQ